MSNTSRKLSSDEVSALMEGLQSGDITANSGLNNDVEVTENWTDNILKQFKSEPNTAVIQPKLKNYHNKSMFDYSGGAGGFLDKYGYPYCRGRIYNKIEQDNNQYDEISDIFWACGACFFIRTDIFKKLNGFDELFWAHFEEIDLSFAPTTNFSL